MAGILLFFNKFSSIMSSESEGDIGNTPSAARYRSVGTKRGRGSEESENGEAPVIKRVYTDSGMLL